MSRVPVAVQAASSHQFHAYLLAGFEAHLGPLDIRFRHDALPRPSHPTRGMALEVQGRRLWIAAGDAAEIDEDALEWCDAYGAVNVLPSQVAASPKVLALGPAFGIRWRSRAHTVGYVARAALAEGASLRSAAERIRSSLRYRSVRRPLSAYDVAPAAEGDRVFFVSTVWERHEGPTGPRARFVEAGRRASGVRFEGGLVPQRGSARAVDIPPELAAPRRIDLDEYLDRTRTSLCAFNSPGVHGCFSWKFGEFLAMGKATITTPIDRALPAPLEHGVHVHQVDDDVDAMTEAIERIAADAPYRRALEQAARAYWDGWLRPDRMAARLLEHAHQRPPSGRT